MYPYKIIINISIFILAIISGILQTNKEWQNTTFMCRHYFCVGHWFDRSKRDWRKTWMFKILLFGKEKGYRWLGTWICQVSFTFYVAYISQINNYPECICIFVLVGSIVILYYSAVCYVDTQNFCNNISG